MGEGSDIAELLDERHAAVVVIEPSPHECLRAFRRHDFSAALAAGRLRLMIVSPTEFSAGEISLRECAAELIARLHRPGSVLRFLAPNPASASTGFFEALSRALEDAAHTVAAFAAVPKVQPAFDVTVVSPACAIFDDLAHCFHRLGLRVRLMRVPDRGGVWTDDDVREARLSLAQAPSRLVVTRNRVLLESQVPLPYPQVDALMPGQFAAWWWDVPNVASHVDLRHRRGNACSFGFARDILPHLAEGAEWLPPGARTAFVEAGTQPEPEQDIVTSFVGQSRLQVLQATIRQMRETLRDLGAHAPAIAKDLEDFRSYRALHAYLADRYDDVAMIAAALEPPFPAHAYFLRYLLDMAVTAAFRIAAIERVLAEGIEVAIYGDDDWLKVPGVTSAAFRGECRQADLPALYRRSRINLNLNFMQVASTVNPKVLDVAAAGAVALTDYRPELDVLYPDPSARPFAFGSLDELPERVRALLGMDLAQHRQAVRAQTCAQHTLQHRALWLARRFGLVRPA
jgi:hypothetical protein